MQKTSHFSDMTLTKWPDMTYFQGDFEWKFDKNLLVSSEKQGQNRGGRHTFRLFIIILRCSHTILVKNKKIQHRSNTLKKKLSDFSRYFERLSKISESRIFFSSNNSFASDTHMKVMNVMMHYNTPTDRVRYFFLFFRFKQQK